MAQVPLKSTDEEELRRIQEEADRFFDRGGGAQKKITSKSWLDRSEQILQQVAKEERVSKAALIQRAEEKGDEKMETALIEFFKLCKEVTPENFFNAKWEVALQGDFSEMEIRSTGRYVDKTFMYSLDIMTGGTYIGSKGLARGLLNFIWQNAPHTVLYAECIHNKFLWMFLRSRGAFYLPGGDPQCLYLMLKK